MKIYIEPIGRLINQFSKLPGVGNKTALRYSYKIINMTDAEANEFAEAILNVKKNVRYCSVCGNFSENEVCEICKNRESNIICVVKEPKDVIAVEKLHEFKGVYHVLHGVISPMQRLGPDDIKIKELLERINKGGVTEIIIATNPDVEGDITATFLASLIKPFNIKVTRLAHGIPIGSDLEYTDEVTLSKAFADRKII